MKNITRRELSTLMQRHDFLIMQVADPENVDGVTRKLRMWSDEHGFTFSCGRSPHRSCFMSEYSPNGYDIQFDRAEELNLMLAYDAEEGSYVKTVRDFTGRVLWRAPKKTKAKKRSKK